MVTQNRGGDKPPNYQVPANLRTVYRTIQWDKLPFKVVVVLSEGAATANVEDLFFVAHGLARLPGAHRPRIIEALSLWCAGYRELERQVVKAVKTAFQTVFGLKGVDPVTKLTRNETKLFNVLCDLQPSPHEEFQTSYTKLVELSGVPIRSTIRAIKTMAEEKFVIEMAQPPKSNLKLGNTYRIPENLG